MKELSNLAKYSLGVMILALVLASCGLEADVIDTPEPMDNFPDTTITTIDRGELSIHHPDGTTLEIQGHGSRILPYDSLDLDFIVISSYEHNCYGVIDTIDLNGQEYYFQITRDVQGELWFEGYFISVNEQGEVTFALSARDFIYFDANSGEERTLESNVEIDELNDDFVRGFIHAEFIILTDPAYNQASSIGEIEFEFAVPFDIEC